MRIGFNRGQNQVTQEWFTGVITRTGGTLQDDRAVCGVGRNHDRLDLFQVVNVERRQAIAIFRCVVEKLTQCYESHLLSPFLKKIIQKIKVELLLQRQHSRR
jgi:hypothetical protein